MRSAFGLTMVAIGGLLVFAGIHGKSVWTEITTAIGTK